MFEALRGFSQSGLPENYYDPYEEATLFCKKNENGACVHFDKIPEKNRLDATVRVLSKGTCSGFIIKLRKGEFVCKPLFYLQQDIVLTLIKYWK